MKNLIYIIILLFTSSLHAQYDGDHILNPSEHKAMGLDKGDNLVVIKTDKPDQANFDTFGRYLVRNGYTIKTKDADYMLLVTDPRSPKQGSYEYALSITFENLDIVIRVKQSALSVGAAMVGHANIIWTSWQYAKGSGNIQNQTFWDFYPVLKEYGFPIEFLTE